jgi:hypothetical protein
MKNLFLCLLCVAFLLGGCLGGSINYLKYEESICENRPAEFATDKSWICEASQKANIAPEEIDNFLLDSTAVLFITEAITREKMSKLVSNARDMTEDDCGKLTYTEFLDNVFDDAVKLQLSLSILSRRLGLYYSNSPISPFDCWLINKAIDHQAEQFGI